MTDDERKKDNDYIRVVDGLARFFNSQITSHGGYLLTMVVIALALSNLALSFNERVTLLLTPYALGGSGYIWSITIISVTIIGLYFAMEWGVARLQYYIALSEVALNHLPYTGSGPVGFMERYYDVMKTRALASTPNVNSLGVRSATSRLFEARLYVSCQNEKNKTRTYELNEQEQKIFHLSEHYLHWGLGPCYAGNSVLRIWRQTNLLLTAYRRTLRSYKKGEPGENREVWNLFKEFVDC